MKGLLDVAGLFDNFEQGASGLEGGDLVLEALLKA